MSVIVERQQIRIKGLTLVFGPLQQAAYKQKDWPKALQNYNMSANIALSRNPWEPSALVRDELAIVICNRSATYSAAGDFLSALVDAEVVINLKRPWSKGHFRKAKALLGLGKLEEARDAVMLGLQFEPDSAVCFSNQCLCINCKAIDTKCIGNVGVQEGDRGRYRETASRSTLTYHLHVDVNCSITCTMQRVVPYGLPSFYVTTF